MKKQVYCKRCKSRKIGLKKFKENSNLNRGAKNPSVLLAWVLRIIGIEKNEQSLARISLKISYMLKKSLISLGIDLKKEAPRKEKVFA